MAILHFPRSFYLRHQSLKKTLTQLQPARIIGNCSCITLLLTSLQANLYLLNLYCVLNKMVNRNTDLLS